MFKKYKKYAEAWPSIVNRYRRSLELKFVLENSGTAPADDVHLNLWTGADGVWLEELPDLPTPARDAEAARLLGVRASTPRCQWIPARFGCTPRQRWPER